MTDDTTTAGQVAAPYRPGRRTAVRVLVPVTVAGVVAAGIGLVPALADGGAPGLPPLTAQQVVAKALGSESRTLTGTVQVSADLGVPAQLLGSAAGLGGGSGLGGGAGAGQQGSPAAPQTELPALLGGEHTLRVAVDGPDRQRVGLIKDLAEYELVRNGSQAWAWDSARNEAVHLALPQGAAAGEAAGAPLTGVPSTPQEAAKRFLDLSADSTSVTVDGTETVAGRKAYRLSVRPTGAGSTIGEVRIAVDADNGVPLAVVVKAADGGATVFDVHFKDVSFAAPAAGTFDFSAPKGAKVTEQKAGGGAPGQAAGKAAKAPGAAGDGLNVLGEGWTSVLGTTLPTGGASAPAGAGGTHGEQFGGRSAQQLAKALGKPVKGGTLIGTKVLNVLITDDGRVFAGAVTLPVLQSAAGVK
ncbi:outer membrane lipoprotein carrier protein LolA [Kitasatospora sp. NBC_00315]|uniref:LolA family protein n=1 Tax=Kitasatospora sp. NBC_00315 TaxID=2975963 RepID=UPI00324FD6EB